MKIVPKENSAEVRRAFIQRFTMTWAEFQKRNQEWIESVAKQNYIVRYEKLYLWELMDYPRISFHQALELLKSMECDVLMMSENESKPHCQGIIIDGRKRKGAVATANAAELADLIESEWNEVGRRCVLPQDLYVFDESLERLLVFTHEYDSKGRRYCKMVGFMCT